MLDIAYLALMLACMAGCVGVIDRLARSEKLVPAASGTPAASAPAPHTATAPEGER
ncbi:hypothetical protein [Dietzia alimentaria]|uniref:hypothetical protein n=1 Tax=Dietzia alimentaria TaxID=665550 RepID=UPI0002ED97D7|nr:hypothetical protein [Dietzia alimentaria]